MSLVGQTILTIRRRESSERPGQVRESSWVTPCASPRFKFFCMRVSLEMKCSADWIGYDFDRVYRWGIRADKSVKRGAGGDVMYRM